MVEEAMSRITRAAILSCAAIVGLVSPVAADSPAPIDAPAEFAELRAQFESMTRAQWEEAGYIANPPVCISSPAGGMGVHAVNPTLAGAQFGSGDVDAANPPVLLVDATQTRVIGLEWESAESAGAFTLFGQTAPLLPGHPGIPTPHYMLHAYFRTNGQVLFAEFDPELTCPAMPNAAAPQPSGGGGWLVVTGLAFVALAAASMGRRRST